jgi:hypothetical protein
MFSKKRNMRDIENGGSETPLALIHGVDIRVEGVQFNLDPYWQKIFQNYTEDQCEHAVRSFNNVILEIVIKWIVYKDKE